MDSGSRRLAEVGAAEVLKAKNSEDIRAILNVLAMPRALVHTQGFSLVIPRKNCW